MREIIYNITQKAAGRRITLTNLTEEFTKDNLLGIINKTQGEVLYTPLQLGNIQTFQYQNGSILITISASVPSINAGDELFVKLYSENDIDLTHIAKEQTLNDGVSTLSSKIDNIDLSSVENKVDEGVETLSNKIDNIDLTSIERKVEEESQAIQGKIDAIPSTDLTSVAKEDTLNTKAEEIKQAVKNIDLTSVENKINTESQSIQSAIQNIDLSSVESKVQEESAAIQAKIDNIKLPEIDTSELASKNLEQFFGITAATEFTPLTTEEITNEINTLWEGL